MEQIRVPSQQHGIFTPTRTCDAGNCRFGIGRSRFGTKATGSVRSRHYDTLKKQIAPIIMGGMDHFPVPLDVLANRQTLSWLLVPVMFLPIGVTILFLCARIFALWSDSFSASVLDGTALALCVLWSLSLIALLLCTVLLLLREES